LHFKLINHKIGHITIRLVSGGRMDILNRPCRLYAPVKSGKSVKPFLGGYFHAVDRSVRGNNTKFQDTKACASA
jgi:hypothetical protein